MRRLGEPASHSRSWVRGNFHITLTLIPTLTPALSLREGEGVSVGPLVPFPGERESSPVAAPGSLARAVGA